MLGVTLAVSVLHVYFSSNNGSYLEIICPVLLLLRTCSYLFFVSSLLAPIETVSVWFARVQKGPQIVVSVASYSGSSFVCRKSRLKGTKFSHSYQHVFQITFFSVSLRLPNVSSALYDLQCAGAPYKPTKPNPLYYVETSETYFFSFSHLR